MHQDCCGHTSEPTGHVMGRAWHYPRTSSALDGTDNAIHTDGSCTYQDEAGYTAGRVRPYIRTSRTSKRTEMVIVPSEWGIPSDGHGATYRRPVPSAGREWLYRRASMAWHRTSGAMPRTARTLLRTSLTLTRTLATSTWAAGRCARMAGRCTRTATPVDIAVVQIHDTMVDLTT
jgi:hypothetical protein